MIDIKITIKKGALAPEYQTSHAAGADIYTFLDKPVTISPNETVLIPTGISIEIPEGYEAQIRPRSGLALKHGITLLNSPGTIDADYRGEIKIIVTNLGKENFEVTNKMRIAQMIFNKVYRSNFIEVEKLGNTKRDDGGFGHSGLK